jgi:hypothetical protein
VGNDKPDSLRQMRYFHNLYGTFQLTPRLGAILGFDLGAEQRIKSSTNYNVWYSPVVILRETLSDRLTIAARGEYYADARGVIVTTTSRNGFQTFGYSLNADVSILENLLWRLEARGFSSRDKIFVTGGRPSNTHYNCTTSIAVSF